MAKPSQVSVNMRKIPRQDRSRFTIEAILDATAQLLEVDSANSVTTNHIARHAGISIGTLYQYFPNKMAVLLALANRGRNSRAKEVVDRLTTIEAGTIDELTRQIIRALIAVYANTRTERQLTMLRMIQQLESPDTDQPIDDVASLLARKMDSLLKAPTSQSEIMSFVLSRSVMGTIRSTLLDAPHLLKEQEFEDQLVRLVTGFLKAQ
jgi:AcrR family transcriptional regulator